MRIKRYVARTIQGALDMVRQDLGPDAVILHTRKARRGMLAGLLGGERFEVIAALDLNIAGEARASRPGPAGSVQASRARQQGPAGRTWPQGSPNPPARPGVDVAGMAGDAAQARWINPGRYPVVAGAYETAPATRLVEMHERLLDMDVDPDLAEALIQAAKMKWREAQVGGKTAYELVLELITGMIPVAGGVGLVPGTRKVVALVGPTGVGKTTTLAKIAALSALFGKKKVAVVTADTYRIAAVEQLRTYAEIIGVPCEVAYAPVEMRQALASHEVCDLVLIDTAGRSPRSGMHMAELKAFLEAARIDEAHLVLSMTTRPRDLLEIVERFSPCGVNRLIFSKLDETTRLGALLGVASSVKIPVSYVTYGQNVPEDIEVADASHLARWILDGTIELATEQACESARKGGNPVPEEEARRTGGAGARDRLARTGGN